MKFFLPHTLTAVALLILPLVGCDEIPAPSQPAAPTESAASATPSEHSAEPLPESLPVADLATLQQLIKETASQDRVLVIDFWATWCQPCVAMFPQLHEDIAALGDKVRMVTVTFDSPGKYEKQAIEFLAQHHSLDDAYIVIPDSDGQLALPATLGQRWKDLVVPAILVFDRKGQLAGEFVDGGVELAGNVVAKARELSESDGNTSHENE